MSPDVLLVHPLFIEKDPVERKIVTPYFPLGLMYLAAVLRQHGYAVEIFDCAFRQDYEEFEAFMQRARPRIVGIAALATVRHHALVLADIARRHGATVVLGGADPTASPERYLAYRGTGGAFPVDVVVSREGEITLLALVDHVFRRGDHASHLREIAGLVLRDEQDGPVATAFRPLVDDLDGLPFPARDLVDLGPYREAWRKAHGYWSLSIINTRGCPYACTWCQKAVFGRTYRVRSPVNVAEEMRHIKSSYAPDRIRVVDDVTGVRKTWLEEWHAALTARDAVIPFECLSRVNLTSEEVLALLKAAGCRKIYFGAESGSQEVLDAMNKEITVEQVYRTAELCRRAGIETHFYMMVGYPGEGWVDLLRSARLLRGTRPDAFSTTIAYPLPGTTFYDGVRERLGFVGDCPPDWIHTAENRLLFRRRGSSTWFYRRVVRWFHSEWRDARLRVSPRPPVSAWLRTKVGLWRDRLLVRLGAVLSTLSGHEFHPTTGSPDA